MDSVLSYLFGAWSIEPLGRPTPGRADLVAAHAVSDGLLAVACFSISVVIVVFVKRRSDFEYGSVAWLFIGFITFCGLTHLISLVTLWVPIYGLHGMVKSVTAIVSLASAIMLWFLLPKILALPSLRDLREKNEALGLEMARCQRYQQELKRTEERFREAFVNAPHGMAILSVDGDFLDVNEAFCQLSGYDRHDLVATKYPLLSPEADRTREMQRVDDLVAGKGNHFNLEKEIVHRSNALIPVTESVSLVPQAGIAPGYMVVQVLDLTAQKEYERWLRDTNAELEKRVAERTKSLAQANHDLNNFNHVLSHDLKSPLRGVRILATEIREALSENNRERAEQCFALLEDRVTRLGRLITDLLAYSRTGRTSMPPEEVDCRTLIESVAKLADIPADFSLEIGEMPVIKTQRVPLETVFRNLIANAIRHHDQAAGRIQFRADLENNTVTFEIEDDGPGIAPEHRETVFVLFRKLSSVANSDSSGLGLTMVQRIVQLNGGTISIHDPAKGRGAVFRFTWPLGAPATSSTFDILPGHQRHEPPARPTLPRGGELQPQAT